MHGQRAVRGQTHRGTTPPANLPVVRARLIGRERDVAAAAELVLRDDVGLVTLTGPAGTGKTRLAVQVATEVHDRFADGVRFVALAPIGDPELLASALARALGLREPSDTPVFDAIEDHLRDKQMLLVLDNFEQLLPAAPLVAELLAACPGLTCLATSRAALGVRDEHRFPVSPLELPDLKRLPAVESLGEFAAVALFVDRASAIRPDFALTKENGPAVADICVRLDGLPLAIELAAAKTALLTPEAMATRQERRLPLLTGGPRDLPARQRTLRDAIAWSYDLLDEAEQALFRRLAVFRGCTLDAVQVVCCAPSTQPGSTSIAVPALDLDPLAGVEALVGASLLRQETAADGQPWYVMLETIREYALERLAESAEADAIHRRHAAHYLGLAEAAEPELTGPDQPAWFGRLEREHDNVRAAIRWCELKGYAEPAFRLALALWWFWAVHGHLGEGRDLVTSLLDRFRPRDASRRHGALRARALQAAGYLARFQNDHRAARAAQEEALRLFHGLDDPIGVESALHALGQVAALQDDYQAARSFAEAAFGLATERNDPWSKSAALAGLANVAHRQGDLATARSLMERAIEVKRHVASPRDLAFHVLTHSALMEEQGDYEAARELYEQSLVQYRQAGDRRTVGLILAKLGGVETSQGRYGAARQALLESLVAFEDLGDLSGVALALEGFATLAATQARPVRALRLAGAAFVLRESFDTSPPTDAPAGRERMLQSARQALDEHVADAAWEAGRALSAADAVAEARADESPEPHTNGRASGLPRVRPGARGPGPLTARECEVATLIAHGYTNRRIAAKLVIAEGTVANHVVNILNRLGVNSRAQIAVWAAEHGLHT